LNNALPLFPNGTNKSKFSASKIVGLLEWSLPPRWRTKFDLDRYVPTMHNKARLIEACEAIEGNKILVEKEGKTNNNNNKKLKIANMENKKKFGGKKHHKQGKGNNYCSKHGKNATHNTVDC